MSFDEWYKTHWWYGSSTDKNRARIAWEAARDLTATQVSEDQHRAQIAWVAAKDFNPTNFYDLEYICEAAISHFVEQGQTTWIERAQKYREKLLRLAGEIPG